MIYNVRDYSNNIQAAIDAAKDGGVIYIPSGIYVIGQPNAPLTSIFLHSNITLCGDGPSTIIQLASGSHSSPLIHTRGTNSGIIIRDLALDENWNSVDEPSNQQGIWLSHCFDSVIERVWAYNHGTNGIVLEYCNNISVSKCFTIKIEKVESIYPVLILLYYLIVIATTIEYLFM